MEEAKSLQPLSASARGRLVMTRRIGFGKSGAGVSSHWRWLLLLTAALLLFAGRAIAQDATVVGTVTDQTGAVVPAATVTVTNLDTGHARTFSTAADGEFAAPALPIGHYAIKVSAKTFKSSEKSGVTLNVGDAFGWISSWKSAAWNRRWRCRPARSTCKRSRAKSAA